MSSLLQPLHLLLMMFAGWVNRYESDVIDYLVEENRVLKERLGGRRIHFTDAERRRLARKAYALGRKVLNELETLVTPDTLLRWHRELVASKWNYGQRRGPGRPRTMETIVDLILRTALENRSWGYTRIRGALANLGHQVARGTIANVLREHGIEPAPERDRHTRWSTFLKAHWECLTATDFLSVEVYTIKGLVTYYIPFFIDLASRSVHIAGITPHPDNRWMTQIARNITDTEDGALHGTRYLILDRDTKYSDEFRNTLVREGIHLIRLPPRSPNLNAFAERFVRSIKSERLNRMIFFGQASLQHAISHFMAHYHTERNHQGLANQLPAARPYHRAISAGASAPASQWNAQVLPPRSSLNRVDPLSGHYEVTFKMMNNAFNIWCSFKVGKCVRQSVPGSS
jgi:putative transposase